MTNALINSDNVIMEELVIITIVTLIKLIYRQNIMERKTKKINQGKKDQKKRGGEKQKQPNKLNMIKKLVR